MLSDALDARALSLVLTKLCAVEECLKKCGPPNTPHTKWTELVKVDPYGIEQCKKDLDDCYQMLQLEFLTGIQSKLTEIDELVNEPQSTPLCSQNCVPANITVIATSAAFQAMLSYQHTDLLSEHPGAHRALWPTSTL